MWVDEWKVSSLVFLPISFPSQFLATFLYLPDVFQYLAKVSWSVRVLPPGMWHHVVGVVH
jgi:hypothetical protein